MNHLFKTSVLRSLISLCLFFGVESFAAQDEIPDWFKSKLEEITNINSGTNNPEGNEAVRKAIIPLFESLGFQSRLITVERNDLKPQQAKVYQHVLVLDFANAKPDILVIGHTDTVFEKFHPFQKYEDKGEIITGPGVADMKGSILLAYHALKSIADPSQLKRFRIVLNDDEEIGSKYTGSILKEFADQAKYGLIFESSQQADISTSHSGIVQKEMTVFGVESHAGAAPLEGVNACVDNSFKMIEIFKLNNYDRGLTFNPGIVQTYAAAKPNTVCGQIKTIWDIRFIYPEDLEESLKKFDKIASTLYAPNPSKKEVRPTSVIQLQFYPALSPERSKFLLEVFKSAAQKLKMQVDARHKGGVDAYGIHETKLHLLTGLGLIGDGMHSDKEYIYSKRYLKKYALVTGFLNELLQH